MGFSVMLTIQVVLAIFLVIIILLQQGKGATAGASFGGGASATVFGSRGSASFLSRTTAVAATLFLLNSLGLAYFYGKVSEEASVVDTIMSKEIEGGNLSEDEFKSPAIDVPKEFLDQGKVD